MVEEMEEVKSITFTPHFFAELGRWKSSGNSNV